MKLVAVFQEEQLLDVIYIDTDGGFGFYHLEEENYQPIIETDVNFDGKTDILIFKGNYGNVAYEKYVCYLGTTDGIVYCPSFETICYPEVDAKKQVIRGFLRDSAASHTGEVYEYINGAFVETERMTLGNTSRDENGTWHDESWNVWIIEKQIDGQLVVTDTFSEKNMNEAEKADLLKTLKGFESYYSLYSE